MTGWRSTDRRNHQLPALNRHVDQLAGCGCAFHLGHMLVQHDASSVSYSPIYRSIIVSFGGAFRVAEEMTYLSALDESGKERWSIKGKLPSRNEGLIVGDFTRTMMFADGRYALLAKTSDRHVAQIIDLANGDATATIRGWPIAAARNAAMAFVKGE